MTVKVLKEFLSKFDDEIDVLIDKSVNGGFPDIQYLTESDITKYGDTKIIIGYDMNADDFVTYEQAVKLKQLGFDWECSHNSMRYLGVETPTLYQVLKWLREIHKLDCNASCDPYCLKWFWYVFSTVEPCEGDHSDSIYDSYENALSLGIDKAIELLKEKNNETIRTL